MMKNALIVYYSRTGNTEQMARYIAEGIRIAGHEAELKSVSEVKSELDLSGYDAYIFGCPTYHLDMPEPFQAFLTMAKLVDLGGKVGAAFDCRTHPSSGTGSAAGLIFDMMESELKMNMTNLGPFDFKPEWLSGGKLESTESIEGMRACQDYGKAVGDMLG
jgi:flavodoxin